MVAPQGFFLGVQEDVTDATGLGAGDNLGLAACLFRLVRGAEIDPCLEMAEIQRRVYSAQGPALYFSRVKSCRFPMVGNLFGTLARGYAAELAARRGALPATTH